MQRAAKGEAEIVPELTLPSTSARPVSLVVTGLSVVAPQAAGLVLRERAPGMGVEAIPAATAAPLTPPQTIPEMSL